MVQFLHQVVRLLRCHHHQEHVGLQADMGLLLGLPRQVAVVVELLPLVDWAVGMEAKVQFLPQVDIGLLLELHLSVAVAEE